MPKSSTYIIYHTVLLLKSIMNLRSGKVKEAPHETYVPRGNKPGAKGTPFTSNELKRLETLLDEQFEREKEEAQFDGQITCLWTGRRCCFCQCGPHLMCPEHNLNCMMNWWGGPNIPSKVDPLLKRWMKWRFGDN